MQPSDQGTTRSGRGGVTRPGSAGVLPARAAETAAHPSSRRIAITGVSGLIGFHLAEGLCRSDPTTTVVGLCRSSNANVQDLLRYPNFRFVPADVAACEELPETLAGVQLLYHLAAQSAIFRARQDPVSDLTTNVTGTLRVLLAADRAGVSKVVFTSGGAVYQSQAHAREEQVGQPLSFYGASKLSAESYVRVAGANLGLRYTILRLARVYGPRMARGAIYDLIQDFQARRPANMFAHPDSVFDFVYVRDVVSALLQAADRGWDSVTANISSGQGTRLRDLHAAFARLFGSSVPLAAVRGEPSLDVLVNDLARSLGWEPSYSLEAGLSETLSDFLPNGPRSWDVNRPMANTE